MKEAKQMHRKYRKAFAGSSLWDLRNEKASSLPYGQQRRLEIVRALATKPRLLLLDDLRPV